MNNGRDNNPAGEGSLHPLVRLSSCHFTPHNSSKAYGVFALDVQGGRIVAKEGWKIIGYGRAPYTNAGDNLALMLEKTEPPVEGKRIWHHVARWMFENQWGQPNESGEGPPPEARSETERSKE